jgi:spermidine/putrescine transport system permease protein
MAVITSSFPTAQRPAIPGVAFLSRHILTLAAFGTTLYLFAPIIIMIVLSFNETQGRFDFVWHGFSLEAWEHPLAVPGLVDALAISLPLAFVVALIATIIGTMTAYAQIRYHFIGKQVLELILLLTISTPEVIMGSSLLNLFIDWGVPMGLGTMMLSHVMFDIAFVAIMVKSRLRSFDIALEHAAMDLGARGWRVFRLITLPIILPSVVTAALFAFMLSLDDFIISMFVSGETVTFPLFVWGEARVAMPPQIYVIGTIMFLVLTLFLIANLLMSRPAKPRVDAGAATGTN